MAQAPNQRPMNRAGMTWRRYRASTIASSGGRIETQETGIVSVASCASDGGRQKCQKNEKREESGELGRRLDGFFSCILGSLAEIAVQYRELFGRAICLHQPFPGVGRISPVFQIPADMFAGDPHTLVLPVGQVKLGNVPLHDIQDFKRRGWRELFAGIQVMPRISRKIQGFPCAARPIIKPLAPVY